MSESVPSHTDWFAGSQVVDAYGAPLVVYHGTRTALVEFEDRPTFFTSDSHVASGYAGGYASRAGDGGTVIPVYLAIRNPVRLDFLAPNTARWYANKRRTWMNRGFDGAVIGQDVFVAFSPSQIRSTIDSNALFHLRSASAMLAFEASARAALDWLAPQPRKHPHV
ncbi:hypothetical protein ACSFA0_25290 [Variovorax sp. LT1P1]|uniref:ADP-ribosyltransferase-containing protein n=1 Tax=Variovorax sp. LT1P1 TaxID=3443730 RepID=UPI003F478BE8